MLCVWILLGVGIAVCFVRFYCFLSFVVYFDVACIGFCGLFCLLSLCLGGLLSEVLTLLWFLWWVVCDCVVLDICLYYCCLGLQVCSCLIVSWNCLFDSLLCVCAICCLCCLLCLFCFNFDVFGLWITWFIWFWLFGLFVSIGLNLVVLLGLFIQAWF